MLPAATDRSRLIPGLGAFTVLASVSLYAFTGNYLLLGIPFGLLFVAFLFLNWKAAYFLLLFLIPASVQLSFLGDTLSTSLPDEPMMWLFLLLFLTLFAARPTLMPEWWWRHPLVFILVLQYLWLIVAVIFSQELFISVKFLAAKTWFMVSFAVLPVLVFQKKRDFTRAFLLMLVPILVYMVIIVIRHKTYGFAFLMITRAVGILYYNRVDYATVMSMFFPLLLVAVPLSRGMKLWWRAALIAIILFFLVAIYLTYARGAMLAVVFAIGMGIATRLRLAKFVMPFMYGLIALLLVTMVRHNKYIDLRPDYEHTYTHLTFTDHMIATLRGQDMSSMERLYRWIAAIRMSNDHPVVGYGPNAFYYHYKPYAVSSFRTYVSRNNEHSTTHNYFLYMLVEQGWPAMILYALLLAVFFAQAQKVYHRFKDRFYRHVTIGLVMLFAAGFINNFFSELLETHKVGALFYIAIALLVVLDQKSRLDARGELEESDRKALPGT